MSNFDLKTEKELIRGKEIMEHFDELCMEIWIDINKNSPRPTKMDQCKEQKQTDSA